MLTETKAEVSTTRPGRHKRLISSDVIAEYLQRLTEEGGTHNFVILAVASARVTRLIVIDSITEPFRARIFRRFPVEGQQVPGPAPKKVHWTTTAVQTSPVRWIVNKGSFIGELLWQAFVIRGPVRPARRRSGPSP